MPNRYNHPGMLDRIRTLAVVVEEGSLNRAAARLRIAQPALSRQMKWLENELGGKLLERETSGVKPTGFCHDVLATMRPVLATYDEGVARLKRQARSGKAELRVGFLISVAQPLLTPALAGFRETYPSLKVRLHDMSPKEQIDALRAGEIDIALVGQEGASATRDFYCRTLGRVGVCAALSSSDPLARKNRLMLSAFKDKAFIGVDEEQVPGRNQWMTTLCRMAGFRPKFVATCDGIHNVLSLVVSETATTFLPEYFQNFAHPGVVFVPIAEAKASWDLIVLWQRGNASKETRAFVNLLSETAKQAWPPKQNRN